MASCLPHCRVAWKAHMKRGLILGTLVVVDALAAAIGAAQQGRGGGAAGPPPPSAAAIQADKIRDNLYLLRGGGRTIQVGGVTLPNAGNSIAFITATGVVLVDTKLAGWGQPIIDKLK